jgi:hypothetical protein
MGARRAGQRKNWERNVAHQNMHSWQQKNKLWHFDAFKNRVYRGIVAFMPAAARPHCIQYFETLRKLAIFLTDFAAVWKVVFLTARDITWYQQINLRSLVISSVSEPEQCLYE